MRGCALSGLAGCALSGLAGTVIMRVNAPVVHRNFLRKRVKSGVNGPCHYKNDKNALATQQ